jgi:aspartate carbamoyltransferase catalytic subunit
MINPTDLSQEEICSLLDLAKKIRANPFDYENACKGKKLAVLFYEPSTRTRLSFETAMLNLGGQVIGFPSASVSSVSKGETIADTIRVVGCFADIAAIRHPNDGAALRAAMFSEIPVINAGDGCHNHPTQTLIDLFTIMERKKRLDNLTIGFCGDLKYGRTVHSLVEVMCRRKNIRFVFISPQELRIPDYIKTDYLAPNNIHYKEKSALNMSGLDILYMTRVQRERFSDENEYERLKDSYTLNADKLKAAPADMPVLHPLPRTSEISLDVDKDSRAAYFEQVQNGVYVRMALILTLLGMNDEVDIGGCDKIEFIAADSKCINPRCISNIEPEYSALIKSNGSCAYCEQRVI